MTRIVIVDLDGTLFNNDHRIPLITGMPKRWDKYHDACTEDVVNDWCLRLVQSLSKSCDIVFITGRPDNYRAKTENLLRDIHIDEYTLYMKPAGDHRTDFEFKAAIYDTHLKDKEVLFALDDRKRTADMWRAKNITCLHCASGDF